MRKNMLTQTKEKKVDLSPKNPSKDMRRVLDNFWNMFNLPKFHEDEPKIEVNNTKDAVIVHAEMPGVAENDMDIEISSDGYLTVSGEKHKRSHEECDGGCFSEVYYGKVSRTVSLPWDLNYDQANAEYNDGVLTISIPKSPAEKQKRKKISVKKNK